MIIASEYDLVEINPDSKMGKRCKHIKTCKYYMFVSKGQKYCPHCHKCALKIKEYRERSFWGIDENGKCCKQYIMVPYYYCAECGKGTTELPDAVCVYKRYRTRIIEAAIMGSADNDSQSLTTPFNSDDSQATERDIAAGSNNSAAKIIPDISYMEELQYFESPSEHTKERWTKWFHVNCDGIRNAIFLHFYKLLSIDYLKGFSPADCLERQVDILAEYISNAYVKFNFRDDKGRYRSCWLGGILRLFYNEGNNLRSVVG